ncbi:Fanconi anemia group G protein [Notolabrus celidotus]|uniref:Fanconi anemia group G protein n=1 Tax=Notolabrus celidotus TaxID=1203425 RepID=UPI0014903F5A|nr:Fanconi anemia group G protein [Notolabrus celidotus]
MTNTMYQTPSLLDAWIKENNNLVITWKDRGDDALTRDQDQIHLRSCSAEFHKLLGKVQGIPHLADHTLLELTVVYNTCVCVTAQSLFSGAELLLKQATERVLQMTVDDHNASDTLVLWRTVLRSEGSKALKPCVLYLLCLQWAIWLATCQLKTIQEFKDELFRLVETLSTGVGDDRRREAASSDFPLLLIDPRCLSEQLQICTVIAQGAERLSEGGSLDALSNLQTASSLSAPRTLVAYTHLLSGSCLSHMSCPQMALQCYRKALETDSRCVCALYQSMLIYRQMGNIQAEIQALRLLHSTLMLPCTTEPALPGTRLLSPSFLLHSQSLSSLLWVPSALSVLHSLAQKCVLHGRVSEGVEYYLDLLAALHSENQHVVQIQIPPLPRMPELYLEAGAALLMAQRPADCMALCEEVISSVKELLPEKVVLEETEEKSEAETRGCAECDDKVEMLLWVAAAYLLQGHCYTHLKDWKQSVTYYTRCINLLVRVRFKKSGFPPQIPSADMVSKKGTDLCILQRLKGLSLAGRGISFTQTDQLREALRDLQLSLQALPECVGAGLWCGEVFWRLGRRLEAAACWEKTWSVTTQSSEESLSVYLQEPQTGPLLDSAGLRRKIQELGTLSA